MLCQTKAEHAIAVQHRPELLRLCNLLRLGLEVELGLVDGVLLSIGKLRANDNGGGLASRAQNTDSHNTDTLTDPGKLKGPKGYVDRLTR